MMACVSQSRLKYSSAPLLETERLRLRSHRISDFNDCCAMWGDPEVTRYIGGRPFTPEEVWARILRYAGHWTMLAFGYWLLEEKDSGAFVGEVGFADFHRDIDPPIRVPEAGWALATQASGKGYATEALRAILQWGEANLDAAQTACIINEENVASIKVAEKCGFRDPQAAVFHGKPILLFHRKMR